MEIDYDRRAQKRKDFIVKEFRNKGVSLDLMSAVYQAVLFSDEELKRLSNRKFKELVRVIVDTILIDSAVFTGIESFDKGGQDDIL